MVINNLKELREVGELSIGDRLVFGSIIMTVFNNYFYTYGGLNHFDTVKRLFQGQNKEKFCSDAYGYPSSNIPMFPEFNSGDYDAAYRVAEKIYIEILGQEDKPKFKVGDKVRIRSWESMSLDFGIGKFSTDGALIRIRDLYFTSSMRHLCGKEMIIVRTYINGEVDLMPIGGYDGTTERCTFNTDMIELVEFKKNISLISDIESKIRPSLSKEIGGYPIERSNDGINFKSEPIETVDGCCTSEKKRCKRFKIRNFLNDRNRK